MHCVIIGFGNDDQAVKTIYEYEDIKGLPLAVPAKNINPYLIDAPTVFLPKRREPICNVPQMSKGSQPTDGDNLLMSDGEKSSLLALEPQAARWIRRFLGADEFINNISLENVALALGFSALLMICITAILVVTVPSLFFV